MTNKKSAPQNIHAKRIIGTVIRRRMQEHFAAYLYNHIVFVGSK